MVRNMRSDRDDDADQLHDAVKRLHGNSNFQRRYILHAHRLDQRHGRWIDGGHKLRSRRYQLCFWNQLFLHR